MNTIYNEDSIKTLDYREAVRESLGMYIGSNDTNGMHHLLTEIVANSMDEAAAGYGSLVKVVINQNHNSAKVIDDGRGIPFRKNQSGNYAVVEMCTNLHSGGKFTGQGNYKSSLGLNGVGATVTNALSSEFSIEVWRDNEHCLFEVFDGEYDDPQIEADTTHKTGSIVRFVPNEEVFGGALWDVARIKEELQLHALLNNGITFELEVISGKKVVDKAKYKYTNGIKDMLDIKTKGRKMLTLPVCATETVELGEESCVVDYAFAYTDATYESLYSFVNGGKTSNHGTHVTGWKTGFTSFINKKGRELGFLKENDKNFTGDLVRRGLVLVLSIKMTERPLFAEQTKQTLNSPNGRTFCSKAIGMLEMEKKVAKQIFEKLLIEQKAEEAAQRKREAQEKIARGGKGMNTLRDLPEKLADASDFTDAEIFFCEGEELPLSI